jgi:hypothetical protein
MTSRRARCLNPLVGNPLGEMEYLYAVHEHRRAGFLEIEAPSVNFPQACEQVCLYRIAALNERPHLREQLGAIQPSNQLHHVSSPHETSG